MTDDQLAAIIGGHLHREYPSKPGHVLADRTEAGPIANLSPVFRGSFDWHSSVHSHWALAVLLGSGGLDDESTRSAVAALDTSFARTRVAAELEQLDRPHRRGFELPYGIAWLLTLGAELAAGSRTSWARAFLPLTELGLARFRAWLERLPGPIRSGEHSQSAFSMSLALDATRSLSLTGAAGEEPGELAALIERRALELYADDADAPIAWEPSAYDFLSPALAEADLMRRVLPEPEFGPWFDRFLPVIDLVPTTAVCRDDGKLSHADGLNLSRAWMLGALGATRPSLAASARAHLDAGLRGLEAATYMGTHWLPTFAVYARRRDIKGQGTLA